MEKKREYRFANRIHPIAASEAIWDDQAICHHSCRMAIRRLRLCRKKNGYFPPDDRGLARNEARSFSRSLAQGLQQMSDAAAREKIEKLIQFCQGAAIARLYPGAALEK